MKTNAHDYFDWLYTDVMRPWWSRYCQSLWYVGGCNILSNLCSARVDGFKSSFTVNSCFFLQFCHLAGPYMFCCSLHKEFDMKFQTSVYNVWKLHTCNFKTVKHIIIKLYFSFSLWKQPLCQISSTSNTMR